MNGGLKMVDHSGLRTNQAVIILLSLLAFVLDTVWLAGLVGVVMLLGTMFKRPGFGFVYQKALKPLGWVKEDTVPDNPEPHRFAQGFGAVVLLVALLVFSVGFVGVGWALVWLVVGLAALNLFAGFCVGCAMYYWLGRLKVPGFGKQPPAGSRPGMRPRAEG